MKLLKYIYVISQHGQMDCVCVEKSVAFEMAEDPECHHREDFGIERWKLVKGKYQFDKVIQREHESK